MKLHAFVKFCLLPRLLRSASDAVFCHLFTLKLHELDVPNWPAGFFWDEVRFWGCMRVTLMLPIYNPCICHVFTLKLHELDVPNWPAGFFWDECVSLYDMSRGMGATPVSFGH